MLNIYQWKLCCINKMSSYLSDSIRIPVTFLLFIGTGDLDRDLERGLLFLLICFGCLFSPGNALASTLLILSKSGFCMPDELGLFDFCGSLFFVLLEEIADVEDLPLLFSNFRLS